MPRIALITLREGTAATWTAANPTLALGEPGWESDTDKLKFGDGVTAWNVLPYFGTSGAPSGPAGGVLAGTYPNPNLNAVVAGTALALVASTTLNVQVDNVTIEVASNKLQVKSGSAPIVGADLYSFVINR